ncbi:cobyrinate a,c-diamide synthase [Clostridium sp. UBA5119]|uniref:cobyrinate a,c-diamide synthase n=1 Tax=Clostridium sp. UBA5119 TaxID=1946366 RepID=UPI003216A45A
MKSIIVSSNSSGGGKTTVTLALMKTLIDRGYKVQGYKVGPDYIDPAFHREITGVATRNLDLFLMGEPGVKESYLRGEGDLGIIEGVMGLYDGKGIDTNFSTAHVSRTLDLPVVLVLSPKAQSATLCAEIEGLRNYENVNIVGIILNNISESYYKLLKKAIEVNCKGIRIFGYIPKDERLALKSRHLGLVQSSEVENLSKKIELCSSLMEEYVDVDSLIEEFKASDIQSTNSEDFHVENKDIKIAVAYDKAFSFYYKENIELLEEVGTVQYFSPLKDKEVPKDVDFIYIGGGYPEVFKEELSSNKSMLNSMRKALNSGVKCYAECGGLMYLTESIDGVETAGFFNGISYMTGKLNNFGYATIKITEENSIVPKDMIINCHEFHKSLVDLKEEEIYELEKKAYDGTTKKWKCGYVKNNVLAAYGHIHFFSNIDFFNSLIK